MLWKYKYALTVSITTSQRSAVTDFPVSHQYLTPR